MFAVNFMGFPQCWEVKVVSTHEQLKSLMDKNIVYKKISKPIKRNFNTYIKHKPPAVTVLANYE